MQGYRPKRLSDMALDPTVRALFAGYIEQGEIPNLLLHGPPGCGKTTLTRVLGRELECTIKEYGPDRERGVGLFRDNGEIRTLLRTRPVAGTSWTLVSLPEAEQLSGDTQKAMRPLMEEGYSKTARLILSTNNVDAIDEAVRQRCKEVNLDPPPWAERFELLSRILATEGLADTPDEIILAYVQAYPHPRQLLTEAEASVVAHGKLEPLPSG